VTGTPHDLYDTTLRDGTQREGVALSVDDKLRVARRMDELGVAYIEGGWPGANPKDTEFFRRAADGELALARDPGRVRDDAWTVASRAEDDPLFGPSSRRGPTSSASSARPGATTWTRRSVSRGTRTSRWCVTRSATCAGSASGSSSTPSTSSTDWLATAPTPVMWSPRRPRPAPSAWCCATPTAARCRGTSARSSTVSSATSPATSGCTSTTTVVARSPTRCSVSRPARSTCRAPPTGSGSGAATPTCSRSSVTSSSSAGCRWSGRSSSSGSPRSATPSPSCATSPPRTSRPTSATPPSATRRAARLGAGQGAGHVPAHRPRRRRQPSAAGRQRARRSQQHRA
jgi:hypothetical protein